MLKKSIVAILACFLMFSLVACGDEAEHMHTSSDWIEDTKATCKTEGTKHKECTECEEVLETGTIEKLTTHTPAEAVKENFVDSDCETEGSYNLVVYCSVCEKKLSSEAKVVEKKEHSPSGWITDSEATCKAAGTKHKECTKCEEVLETGTIEKLTTHTPAEAVKENFVDSNCETEGSYNSVVYCSVCEVKLSSEAKVVEKKEHTPSGWITDSEATCKAAGTKHKECTECEKVLETGTIEKLTTHTPAEAVKENFVDSDCETEGSYNSVVYCSVCEAKLSSEAKTVGKKDHTPVADAAVPASCKNTGLTEGSHCSICDKILVKQNEVPKEEHAYVNGYCSICNEKKVSEGLQFENYDGYAAVTGIGSCTDTVIIIPDYAPSGLPVKEIGMQAFQNCTNIVEVIIPDAVGAILNEAFMNCTSLEKITLPSEYWDIQLRTFKNCTALREVIIPNNVFRVGAEAFANCTSLENITIPTSVTTYSKDAFKGCTIKNLYISSLDAWFNSKFNNSNSNPLYCAENLYLNKALVTTVEINQNIPFGAFMGYEKLTKVVLGNSVKSIGDSAFYGCSGLTEVVFGNKVETIGSSAFYNCTKLTATQLPSSLKTLSNKAFYGCSALQTVTIASGLQSVGDYAFSGCIALRAIDFPVTVTYMGISCLEKCASLESITIPFVGVSTCEEQYAPFGSLFGSAQYEGGDIIQIKQSVGTQIFEYSYCIPISLKHVKILKQDITYSSTRGFMDCKYIESITFGKDVTGVWSGSIRGCTALTNIYYEGTKEEWKNLRYSEAFDTIENITITCSDGVLEKVSSN